MGSHRVARIRRRHRSRAIRGYPTHRRIVGRASIIAPNRLQRECTVDAPDKAGVTDLASIRAWQGWLDRAVVVDMSARQVVGGAMKPTPARELVLAALLRAAVRRRPKGIVVVHAAQGTQYGRDDWHRFCQANPLQPSMSRRASCRDNPVVETFFSRLKTARIRQRLYKTREPARADIFAYLAVFYPRRHSHLGGVSPEAFDSASL